MVGVAGDVVCRVHEVWEGERRLGVVNCSHRRRLADCVLITRLVERVFMDENWGSLAGWGRALRSLFTHSWVL